MGIIFHIDVNSAYLSWTAVKLLKEATKDEKKIDIRNIPAIIGGDRGKATRNSFGKIHLRKKVWNSYR